MKIQLLLFHECPNAPAARDALRQALREEHLGLAIDEVDIAAPETPPELRAWGSPTILIDSIELTGAPAAKGDIGCRLYPGGAPSVADIRAALQRRRRGGPGGGGHGGGGRGGLPLLGALFAAIAASACCLVPAVLALVGISGAGIAATLAPARPYLLAGTALALITGMWLAYRPAGTCVDTCACPAPQSRRFARWWLWLGVVVTLGVAAYPWLFDGRAAASGEARRGVAELAFHVDGMDCRACTTKLVQELARVPGVATADVDYDAEVAVVTHDGTRDPTQDVLDAIRHLGYQGRAIPAPPPHRLADHPR